VPVGFDDARQQPLLRERARGVAHQPLVVAQQRVEAQRVGPIEGHAAHRGAVERVG
jgi:hypothetical protein